MYRAKRWLVENERPGAQELASKLKISPLVAQALLLRGITGDTDARAFLNPSLKLLADPALLGGLVPAAARVAEAIRAKDPIVVYGDYDVDGITATSILWHAITRLGGVVTTYIPHRIEEGYGLNAQALQQIIDNGAKLVITVDCGITAIEAAKVARERGVDLIITDHHEWRGDPPQLPDCAGIVHPRLGMQTPYPNPHLCGAGVAFKLAWGIGQAMHEARRVSDDFRQFLLDATALAALGTIADVVPLLGENRILAHFGLSGLQKTSLIGIRALIESANLTGKNLDSYDVGFMLAPRLNACGRLGHAAAAVEMLTTADAARAMEIALFLESQNRDRQAVEKKIFLQAMEQVQAQNAARDDRSALVIAGEGWHPGVIGIVASRIVERFCRPVIMIAIVEGIGHASGRSIPGFHLKNALDACTEHLISHGGHEMAAGLKIEAGKIDAFREAFVAYSGERITRQMMMPLLHVDATAEISQISEALVRDLQRLGPFGAGNHRPVVRISNANLVGTPRRVGKTGDHLQFRLVQDRRAIQCIAFGAGELADRMEAGASISVAGEPCLNEYNGQVNVQLEIKDVQFAGSDVVA